MAKDVYDFIHELQYEDLPCRAVETVKGYLLDLIGTAMGGEQTDLSRIIRNHAVEFYGVGTKSARLLCDGRLASPAGAALAGGMTIDALDGHDGQKLTKGHVGCGVLPALLAYFEAEGVHDPKEFITCLVLGYELGTRAGIALHKSVPDYHTSGAWIAVACAALGARVMGLSRAQTREAVGIAEYHGPRSQMMRCIDHPTMVKDGSGWGAMAGVSAAYLAADGFTGAPAITLEADSVKDIWADLGTRWFVFEQYIKLFPVCRWAQPPLQAVLNLRARHGLVSTEVERIEVSTFHESIRLAVREPKTTEEAQYSTAYPTAVGLVRGGVNAQDVSAEAFDDPEIKRLAGSMVFQESDEYNAAFPAKRFADVRLVLKDGRVLASSTTEAMGDPEKPIGWDGIEAKFRAGISCDASDRTIQAVRDLENASSLEGLYKLIY